MAQKLSRSMTEAQFDNGYWYATELKAFALSLGVPSGGKLRKDQLEREIRRFFRSGSVSAARPRVPSPAGPADHELGLRMDLPIVRYVNNKQTKTFIIEQCHRQDPDFRLQSGTRYLLNRWREEQMAAGKQITYGDLVRQFIHLNATKAGPLRTEHGRYNNFFSDYRAAHKGAPHSEAVGAWNQLKTLDIPKTYQAWRQFHKDRLIAAKARGPESPE